MGHATDDDDLPQAWPFTLAGVFLTLGIVWFCLGFAVHDAGKSLWGHYSVWWACVLVALALVIGGGIWNTLRSRRRIAEEH